MKIPEAIEAFKRHTAERHVLILQRNGYLAEMKKAESFFKQQAGFQKKGNQSDVAAAPCQEAAAELVEIFAAIGEIDRQILDLDIILATTLESNSLDFVFRVHMENKVNDAGDIINEQSLYGVPIRSDDDRDLVEITPEDLYFVKLMKATFSIRNLEVISRKQYYGT